MRGLRRGLGRRGTHAPEGNEVEHEPPTHGAPLERAVRERALS